MALRCAISFADRTELLEVIQPVLMSFVFGSTEKELPLRAPDFIPTEQLRNIVV
jgi:hypothetical protein